MLTSVASRGKGEKKRVTTSTYQLDLQNLVITVYEPEGESHAVR